jgi:hypothetical protein
MATTGLDAVLNEIETLKQKVSRSFDTVHSMGGTVPETKALSNLPAAIASLAGSPEWSIDGSMLMTVEVNVPGAAYDLPTDATERAEILAGAYVAVSVPGYLMAPLKVTLDKLEDFITNIVVPVPETNPVSATVSLVLGHSATCAYRASPVEITLASGTSRSVQFRTHQMSGSGTTVEIARVQPYTSTASDSGDSWLMQKVTSATGTRTYLGYYNTNDTFVRDAGLKVGVWTVPSTAETIADCTEELAYGSATDTDIFSLLKVLGEEKIVDVNYVGDSSTITNKFVRFSPVYVKTTFEDVEVPIHNDYGETTGHKTVKCVIRWFCNTKADPDYHLHSAFVRYIRDGESFTEQEVPYAYVSRYPINNVSLTCGGVSYSMAKSQADGSNEVGNTREGFLGRCRNVNKATITVTDPDTDATLLTVPANSDSRAMSMIDLPMISLIEDLAYLLFGVDSQSQLRGVSTNTNPAQAQQANGTTDFIANLGVKLGGQNRTSSEFNFNFLDIEGGTWSAPGCMFPNYTSIMERITTTDAEGVPTSTTRNRYVVAIDRLDYNPGSSDVENMTANGYRWVAFNVGSNKRIGLDDTQVMRDAKLFCTDQTTTNVNYATKDAHWQGSAPSAIANYSSSATYAVNAYAVYDGKLYRCITAVETAEAFDSEKWELQVNKTIISRSCFLVARGNHRDSGGGLGAVTLGAGNALGYSDGYAWRSRLSFLPTGAE